MFLFTGHIVTEIEAVEILTGLTPTQVAAGGIGGAEGSCRLLFRGPQHQVQAALELVRSIHGEPAFVE